MAGYIPSCPYCGWLPEYENLPAIGAAPPTRPLWSSLSAERILRRFASSSTANTAKMQTRAAPIPPMMYDIFADTDDELNCDEEEGGGEVDDETDIPIPEETVDAAVTPASAFEFPPDPDPAVVA
ncbi:hypothetical protein HDU84_006556 [Entophlyctis sp. JEL0112]|nr:hypothetical protein HDU84_006556 [Entophlyctis sp. JEL0112]